MLGNIAEVMAGIDIVGAALTYLNSGSPFRRFTVPGLGTAIIILRCLAMGCAVCSHSIQDANPRMYQGDS